MVRQTEYADKKHSNQVSLADYSSQTASKSNRTLLQKSFSDELIVSLADSYENKRARQVVEWERLQRRNFIQAF